MSEPKNRYALTLVLSFSCLRRSLSLPKPAAVSPPDRAAAEALLADFREREPEIFGTINFEAAANVEDKAGIASVEELLGKADAGRDVSLGASIAFK